MKNSVLPFITVCMPVRNEERFIERTIQELLTQDYPKDRFEIIVADGESTDNTKAIIRKISQDNPNVILLNNPRKLSSAGRNIGFKKGRGDIFLVVDGHCYIGSNQLFKNIINCFEKSGTQCLGRAQPLDPPDVSDFQKAVAFARSSKIGHSSDSFIYSDYEGCVSPISHGGIYKKKIFEKIGYVDESFDACEDVEFNYRVEKARFRAYMSPAIAIKYYPRENLSKLFRQMVRYGSGRFKFLRKHPETMSLNLLIPVFFTSGFILFPPLGLISPSFWLFFGAMYFLYFFMVIIVSLTICTREGFKYLTSLLSIFFVIHFGLGWGFLKTICFPKKLGS